MKQKKKPLRMCLGCREMKLKKVLIRVVKDQNGEISIDTTGKKAGRGAYICNDITCFQKVRKIKQLERAFSKRIDDVLYDELEKALGSCDEE